MNRAELIEAIAKHTGHSKQQVSDTVTAILHNVTGALMKGQRVTLVGFGTFERRHRSARVGVNPQNPQQKLRIAAAHVPAFRAGQELKDIVDGRAKLSIAPKGIGPSKAASSPKKKASKAPAKKKSTKKGRR